MNETARNEAPQPTSADRATDAGVAPKKLEGRCECDSSRWELAAGTPMGPMVACHCGQCNRSSSHIVAAVNVAETGLSWTRTEHLIWYASSDFAERGFCGRCGSQMAWRQSDPRVRTGTSLMAGSFDDKDILTLKRHIYVDHKAPYYDITDDLPQYPHSD